MGQFLTGSRKHAIIEIDHTDSPYTILDTGADTIFGDTDGGAITLIMPTLAANQGRIMTVKNVGTSGNDITANGEGAETIDHELTQSISDLESAQMQAQSQEWSIV